MKVSTRNFCVMLSMTVAVGFITGCASSNKRMEPVSQRQMDEFLRSMEVAEKPSLEPDWADYVKDSYPNWRRHYWVDRGQWGNRGFLSSNTQISEPNPLLEAEFTPLPPTPPSIIDTEVSQIEIIDQDEDYVVQKGDSLWKIAGKVYGDPLKWPKIYRANKEKLKNPNVIYPNQVLTIP